MGVARSKVVHDHRVGQPFSGEHLAVRLAELGDVKVGLAPHQVFGLVAVVGVPHRCVGGDTGLIQEDRARNHGGIDQRIDYKVDHRTGRHVSQGAGHGLAGDVTTEGVDLIDRPDR